MIILASARISAVRKNASTNCSCVNFLPSKTGHLPSFNAAMTLRNVVLAFLRFFAATFSSPFWVTRKAALSRRFYFYWTVTLRAWNVPRVSTVEHLETRHDSGHALDQLSPSCCDGAALRRIEHFLRDQLPFFDDLVIGVRIEDRSQSSSGGL